LFSKQKKGNPKKKRGKHSKKEQCSHPKRRKEKRKEG
jgi:hypothetical protein